MTRGLRITMDLIVEVVVPEILAPHLPPVDVRDPEAARRLVELVTMRALDEAGLAPVSGGSRVLRAQAARGGM